jgi:hypothetical protein
MEIRIRTSGQVMYESEFRNHMRETTGASWEQTTGEVLTSLDADVVFEGPQATGGTVYQYSMRQGVEQVDGKWYTKYVLGPIFTDTAATDTTPAKTAAENEADYKTAKDTEQAKSVRSTRDTKLKDTDWTQIADATVNKTVWATYRQALRDVPTQSGFPWTITWPTQPE